MKKTLSFILAMIVISSIIIIPASAKGTLIFSDDFDLGFKPANWIQGNSCKFSWDSYNQCIHGYRNAVVLQSNYGARDAKMWDRFYAKFDVQIRGFDDITPPTGNHVIKLWYRDLFENADGTGGAIYTFSVEIETGLATLYKEHSFSYRDDNNILQNATIRSTIAEGYISDKIEVGEDAPWYELGLRVSEGRIEGWFEQELIVWSEVDENDDRLGNFALNSVDPSVGTQRSPILFWNGDSDASLWTALDNFEVWTPDYDFVEIVHGDVSKDSIVNAYDAVLVMQRIAGWDVDINELAADVNLDGIVNLADVIKIMQHVAGWDVILGSAA